MRVWMLSGLFLLLALSGCGLLSLGSSPETAFCDDPAAAVEDFGHVTLPPSYTALTVECSGFMDHRTLNARFAMNPADLAAFQQSTLVETWHTTPETPPDLPYSFGGLLPDGALATLPAYFYGLHEPIVPVAQQIIIDTSDPAQYIVYLTAFTSY